jgi:Rrf2 family protein
MRMTEGVEWALHCTTVLALVPAGMALSGSRLAEFHGVPAPYLAKSLQALCRAGIAESVRGRRGGFRLARPLEDISLLDVVLAVEGEAPAFRCTEIRKRGPGRVAPSCYTPTCSIAAAMWQAEEAWRASLASRSIADLLVGLVGTVPPEAAAKAATWMQEVLS